jgi:hypothetical protein
VPVGGPDGQTVDDLYIEQDMSQPGTLLTVGAAA